MRKFLMLMFVPLVFCGCERTRGGSEPGGVTPELQQKITLLNQELATLRELTAAVGNSPVRQVERTASEVSLTFRDGSTFRLVCNPEASASLVGVARDGDQYYWTVDGGSTRPWLVDAQGERMAVSGDAPVLGVDDEGFWTVSVGEAQAWRILCDGKPIVADEEVSTQLFRAVAEQAGSVTVTLADGEVLTAGQIADLGAAGTANCYVVRGAGCYLFDASVRGNGVGDQASVGVEPQIAHSEQMTACWLWASAEGLLSEVAFDPATGEISFCASEATGNAVIALMLDGEVVWSWHIWMTTQLQTMAYANGVVFMDRNLGAVGADPGTTEAYGMYYQWGRKDPFFGGTTTETSSTAFAEAKKGTVVNPACGDYVWSAATGAFSTAAYAAAHPMTFLYNKIGTSSNYDWLAVPKNTMWTAEKNLNDPCPPGYKVPAVEAWADVCAGRQYIDGISDWDGAKYGMTYAHGEQTAWYPAQGYRNQSTGSIVGLGTTRSGNYWSSGAASATSKFFYFQKRLSSSSGSVNLELDKSRAFGYTVRCCKE